MIVRVRRHSGDAGGRNHYHHADIICKNKRDAWLACRNGIVSNWRWIDSFDTCDRSYVRYEVMYEVSEESSKNPMKPKAQECIY